MAIHPGDRFQVTLDKQVPSLVHIRRAVTVDTASCLLVTGVAVIAVGIVAVLADAQDRLFPDTEIAFVMPALMVLAVCLGGVGFAHGANLLRGLPGSRRIRGQVIDSEIVPTGQGKNVHQPLLEYELAGLTRRVWSTPRWRKPKEGQELTARISGIPPREVVRCTPMALSGLVLLFCIGLGGLALLAYLAGAAVAG